MVGLTQGSSVPRRDGVGELLVDNALAVDVEQRLSIGGAADSQLHTVVCGYLMSRRKRALDLLIGVPLALVALPIIFVLAVGSGLSLKAWPFFVQDRVGKQGRSFRFVKIRSLPVHAPRYADKYAIHGVQTTRFGRFLRATHLDELPQLWLVVAGRMSLVGPRPEMQELCDTFATDFVHSRTLVVPGCTGLWQVSTDAGKLIGEVPVYDLYYLEAASLRFDGWLLWRTARGLLGSRHAVSLDKMPNF